VTARNGAATKGPATDTPIRPKMSASQREMAAMRKELDEVKAQSAGTTWLLAQLLYELRMQVIRQALATPEGQEAAAQKLMNEMNGQPPPVG
jgi:hypothetical protein